MNRFKSSSTCLFLHLCTNICSGDSSSQMYLQGSYRLEKNSNLEGILEKSLKIKPALKSTGKLLKSLEKSLFSTFFCRT